MAQMCPTGERPIPDLILWQDLTICPRWGPDVQSYTQLVAGGGLQKMNDIHDILGGSLVSCFYLFIIS